MRAATVIMSTLIAVQGCLASGAAANIKLKDVKPVPNAKYASLSGLASGSSTAQARQKEWVGKLGLPLEVESKKVGIKLRLIPPGTFTMGSPSSEEKRGSGETQHRVTLTQPFYCGKFEVTQGQWKQIGRAHV